MSERELRAKAGRLRRETETTRDEYLRDFDEVLRERIKFWRERRGYSVPDLQRVLVERVGWKVDQMAIHRIERGERKVKASELIYFAIALDVGVLDLVEPFDGKAIRIGDKAGGREYSSIGDQIAGEESWLGYLRVWKGGSEDEELTIVEPDPEKPRIGPADFYSYRMDEIDLGELWRLFAKVRRTARWVAGRSAPPIVLNEKGELTSASEIARESAQDDVALVRAVAAQTKARIDEWETTDTRRLLGVIEEAGK